MLLSDKDIRAEIDNGRVRIDPFDDSMVQPSSIDVRLDRYFRVFENHRYPHIDPSVEQVDLTRLVEPEGDEPFILHPGEFVLASTYEVVSLPDDLASRLEGKSSLGRLGLVTHSTAGFIDPGFSGHVTLELSNLATLPIKLWPGMKIGQLCLFRLTSPAEHPYGSERYGSRYQGQRGRPPPGPSSISIGPRYEPRDEQDEQDARMSDVRENLTYEQFGVAVRELAQAVADDGYEPDIVLSIARGGVFVAGGLAYALDCKNIHLVNVEFYTGVGTTLDMPVMLAPVPNVIDFSDKKVLITDDVADTGKTLKLVRDFCLDTVAEVRSAVIYEKSHSLVQCEYVWKRTDDWINFPWSVQPPVVRRQGQVLDA